MPGFVSHSVFIVATWIAAICGGIGIGAAFISAIVGYQLTENSLTDANEKIATARSDADSKIGVAREEAKVELGKAQADIAKANVAIAQADARAAEANAKAETERVERLKLEAKLAPRALGPAKQALLTAALQPILTGIGVDLIVFESLGPDVGPLSREIAKAITDAGITVRILTPLPSGLFATGVLVRAEVGSPANVMAAVEPTANALRQVGLDAGAWEPYPTGEAPAGAYNGPGGPNSNFRILIGTKP